jgi:hypothetical protein
VGWYSLDPLPSIYIHHFLVSPSSPSPSAQLSTEHLNLCICSHLAGSHGAGKEAAQGEGAEDAEGAEGQALHNPPMRRHAPLLE